MRRAEMICVDEVVPSGGVTCWRCQAAPAQGPFLALPEKQYSGLAVLAFRPEVSIGIAYRTINCIINKARLA
jgi:hypothetical protein